MMDQEQTLSVLDLPDELLLKVFMSLQLQNVRCVSLTCSRFSRVVRYQQLWKTMFQRDFQVPKSVPLRPKASSWRAEYRRLYDESPAVLCKEVLGHADDVWHVSFSHNGEMFATCSQDGLVKVWETTTPFIVRFTADMKTRLNWHCTLYSQFNESDSLLLVTGVVDDFKGEVVIFDMNQDLKLLRRILNRPFTVFGTWFDDHHVLSGTLHPTDFIFSVWLAKATREVKSNRKYDMINPYRFKFLTNGGIGRLMLVDAPIQTEARSSTSVGQIAACSEFGQNDPHSDLNESHLECDEKMPSHRHQVCECGEDAAGCPVHASVPFIKNTTTSSPSTHNRSTTSRTNKPALDSPQVRSSIKTQKEKLLIFTYGEVSFYSNMVGIKRMREDEILKEEEAREGLRWPETDNRRFLPHTYFDVGGTGRLSNLDHSFNTNGRIVGMALSPDQKYLYVNTRRRTEDYVIDDETEPQVAYAIDILIISLISFTKVDIILGSHKTFIRDQVFCLNVNEFYVASGSGHKEGYIWDRHYGVHVRCFPHDDVVSCCAFSTADPEMLVTGSDDNKIKIWRSRRQMREVTEKKKVYKYETATPAPVAVGNCLEGRDNSDTLSGRRETTREDCNCSFLFCCFRK